MQRRTVVSIALFLALVVVGLAGADKPPPPGFVLYVVLAGAISLIVWWRAPHWTRPVHGARDGAFVGLFVAALAAISPDEPTVQVPLWMRGAVALGAVVAGAIFGLLLGALLSQRRSHAADVPS
jgi:MFS family permease